MSEHGSGLAVVGCGAIAHWHLDAIERAGVPVTVTAAIDPVEDNAASRRRAHRRAGVRVARRRARRPAVRRRARSRCRITCTRRSRPRRSAPGCTCCSRSRSRRRSTRATASSPPPTRPGTVFMVAENAQYWPEVLTVRDLLADGAIGEVVTARAATFFPALGDFYGGDRPWRFDRGGRGRRRGDRHRLALAAAAARVARRSRRGRRRARPPAPRDGGRVAVPGADPLRVGRGRRVRRHARDRRDREPAVVHRHRQPRRAAPSRARAG